MSQFKREPSPFKQKTGELTHLATHHLQKWHYQAKKNMVGVSLNEQLQHEMRCLKFDLVRKKRSIDSQFNQAVLRWIRSMKIRVNPMTVRKKSERFKKLDLNQTLSSPFRKPEKSIGQRLKLLVTDKFKSE